MTTVPLILEEDCERGGKDYNEEGIENEFVYRNNVLQASKTIRLGFIRKVYGLLSMQLLLTIVVASIFMCTPQIKSFVHEKYVSNYLLKNAKRIYCSDWMLFASFIPSIMLLIALIIKRRDTPTNLILLAAFVCSFIPFCSIIH